MHATLIELCEICEAWNMAHGLATPEVKPQGLTRDQWIAMGKQWASAFGG